MFIMIEPTSSVPIYEQLTRQIIEGIVKGEIKVGDTLPSVRAMAADLGVNMHTVNKSYKALAEKGVVTIKAKSGAVVCAGDVLNEQQILYLQQALKPVLAEGIVLGATEQQLENMLQQLLRELTTKEAML